MAEQSKGAGSSGPESEYGRSIGDIRRDIDERRQSISETVSELDERVKSAFDWKEYPWLALGCAAVAGFTVARMIKPRQSGGERLLEMFSENAQRFGRGYDSPRSGVFGLAMGALAAAAGRAASTYFVERYGAGPGPNGDAAAEGDETTAFTDVKRF